MLQMKIITCYFVSQSTFNHSPMTDEKEQLEAIADIRNMMERSTRFLSLSGLSGVFAGIFALAGAGAAYMRLEKALFAAEYTDSLPMLTGPVTSGAIGRGAGTFTFIFADAVLVLLASLLVGFFFTYRKAKKKGLKVWDGSSRRMAFSLFIPLAAGGIFCLELLHHQMISMVAPATLLFYGMALLNAGKYTFNDIRYLGITEIVLGLVAAWFHGSPLLFWAIGFGLMHIVYGASMWLKYERN
jgi:hypothetical protein